MTALPKTRNWVFWCGLVGCTVYQSYRYPLQINSSLTSPTYTDTPFWLQAGKFLLCCPLLFFAATYCIRKPLARMQWLVTSLVLFLFVFGFLKAISGGGPSYLEPTFWMASSVLLVWAVDIIHLEEIERYLRFLLLFGLSSTFIQVLLLVLFGRLPALAYEGTISIRFGAFLDDPNGYSAILFLLMGWSYGRYRGRKRAFWVGSILLMFLLAQSWTALIFLGLVCFVWGVAHIPRTPLKVLVICMVVCIAVSISLRNAPDTVVSAFNTILEAKQRSAEGHAFPWAQLGPRWTEWIFFGQSSYIPYESWWAGALVNFGLPWICIHAVTIAIITFFTGMSLYRANDHARPVYLGLFLFEAYFIFGSINLPFPSVFPVNVILFLLSFLVLFGKIAPDHESIAFSANGESVLLRPA
jgi:hypothetical protein